MAVVTEKGLVVTSLDAKPVEYVDNRKLGAEVRVAQEFHEIGTHSATSTFTLLRIPTNAIIVDGFIAGDAGFASAGTATVDVGLEAVGGNVTSDLDILLDAVDIETAAFKYHFFNDSGAGVANIEDACKPIWELLGETSDPGGFVNIVITLNTTLTTGDGIKAVCMYVTD